MSNPNTGGTAELREKLRLSEVMDCTLEDLRIVALDAIDLAATLEAERDDANKIAAAAKEQNERLVERVAELEAALNAMKGERFRLRAACAGVLGNQRATKIRKTTVAKPFSRQHSSTRDAVENAIDIAKSNTPTKWDNINSRNDTRWEGFQS